MKFYNEDDLDNGNFEKGWAIIEEISRRADEKAKLLSESPSPEFSTIEEALDYYHKQGCLTFEEWENNMREKHGL